MGRVKLGRGSNESNNSNDKEHSNKDPAERYAITYK
jgi:hypothetical protein